MTRVPDPSVETASRRSGSTSTPARSTNSAPGWIRSSPSALKSPSFVRQRFCWSFRMVLSFSLSAEVITETKRAPLRGARESLVFRDRLSGRGLPGFLGKTSERLGVADGDVREHLAVELDAGLLEAVHELAVAHALLAGGGVDAHDPELAKVPLLVAAVAVGVSVRLEEGLLGPLVARVRLPAEALGPLERRAALLARVYRTLDPAHLCNSSVTRLWSASETTTGRPRCRLRLALFFPRLWLVKECRARSFPLAVFLKRFFAPEWVFIFGMRTVY